MNRPRWVLTTLAVLVVLPCVAAGHSAAATHAAPVTPADVRVDVTVVRQGDELVYRLEFDVPAAVTGLRVQPYTGRIEGSSGFERPSESSRELTWDGTDSPSMTVVKGLSTDDCTCVVTDDLAMVQPLHVRLQVEGPDGWTTAHLTDWFETPTVSTSVTVEGGRFLDGLVAVGPTTVANRTTRTGERIRVVAPTDATAATAAAVADRMAVGAPLFDVGSPSDRPVTVVVLPHVSPGAPGVVATWQGSRGIAALNGYVYVRGDTGPGTWLHEYVHTRQPYSVGARMQWFPEATAEYYGMVLADRTDPPSDDRDRVARRFGEPGATGVLAESGSWGSVYVPYDRGGRLIWYLDGRIRAETNGERTFLAVLRLLDGRRVVTLDDLQAAVAEVVGSHGLDDEIVRYATTDEPIPTNRTAFAVAPPGPAGPSDGPSAGLAGSARRGDRPASPPRVALAFWLVLLLGVTAGSGYAGRRRR